MRAMGLCTDCNRVRTVRIGEAGMRNMAMGRMPYGSCGCTDSPRDGTGRDLAALRGQRVVVTDQKGRTYKGRLVLVTQRDIVLQLDPEGPLDTGRSVRFAGGRVPQYHTVEPDPTDGDE